MTSPSRTRLVLASLTALATVGTLITPSASAQPESPGGYQATITRTEYGIPHVSASDLPSAGFGYGYAFAQDNICTLADLVTTLRGERSRFFGPKGVANTGLSSSSNLDSDVYHRSVNDSGVLRDLLRADGRLAPSARAKALITGYVAGVNRYLARTGVHRLPDPTCRGKAWVRPITTTDVWRNVYDINQLGGTAALLEQIATAKPPSGPTPAAARTPVELRRPDYGSNAWAIGGKLTRGGRGMLLGNPHFPWQGGKRFYQAQLTVPGELNVSGAGIYGTPFTAIGHNSSLAWTHTVSTAQRFTLFQLRLADGDPTRYLVDGKPERMTARTVRVPVRTADGRMSTVHRKLYTSRYGPVLAQGWTDKSAFAVRGANVHNLRSVDEWLGYAAARDVPELRRVQRKYQGIPFVNTFAADSRGRAYFADASVVPHVTDAKARACVDTPEGQAMYPNQTVLNGARSECDWGTDRGAIEPGLFGPDRMPRQQRSDYVSNSNESPWLTNVDAPLRGYPRIFGDIAEQRSLRDRLSHTMIADRASGADGLGPRGFDLRSLRKTMFGNRVLSAELLRADLVTMCGNNPRLRASDGSMVDVRAACRVLARWDGRADGDSRGMPLWHEFYQRAGQADDLYRVPFDPRDPVHTPNTLNRASTKVRAALADAVLAFRRVGRALDSPLGSVQRAKGVPIHGCAGGDGCFNVITPQRAELGADGYGPIVHGTSFVLAVEFTAAGPKASTVLSYSQSANPASPHYADQTRLYAAKRWVRSRFTAAEIAAAPGARTIVVRG